jgi:phosphoglycerol transferase MdoB-like AlkP superfamily enzyme
MSQPEDDFAATALEAIAVPLTDAGDELAALSLPAFPVQRVSAARRLYLTTRIYIAFTLWFVLSWLASDFYYYHPGHLDIFRVEYPLALYLFFALNQILRPSRWRPLLAGLPIFAIYLLHDGYYVFFDDIPTLAQLRELPELYTVGNFWMRAALVSMGLGLLWFLVRQVRYNCRSLVASLPILTLALGTVAAPAKVMAIIEDGVILMNPWLQADNAVVNGRLTTAIYNEAKRRLAVSELSSYEDNKGEQQYYNKVLGYLKEHAHRDRQVFIIVLESFLDPRLLKPLKGHEEYLDADFLHRYGKGLGYSISPVFGGGTAQAEFEVLCGVPAFSEFSKMEFNLFSGRPIPCLPQILGKLGYGTMANYPYIPTFFNARRAYPGIGFNKTYYAREYTDLPTYLHLEKPGQYLSDGAFFQQNRDFLEQHPADKPFLNYDLTLYGHMYYDVERPIKWRIGSKDPYLERIVNISYYRTAALDHYLQWIGTRYPKSLVIALADHLPLLGDGPLTYKSMHYLDDRKDNIHYNRVLVVKDGKPVKLPAMEHFSVPYLVYDYLTDGGFCKNFDCPTHSPYDTEKLRDRYHYLMANAALKNSADKTASP